MGGGTPSGTTKQENAANPSPSQDRDDLGDDLQAKVKDQISIMEDVASRLTEEEKEIGHRMKAVELDIESRYETGNLEHFMDMLDWNTKESADFMLGHQYLVIVVSDKSCIIRDNFLVIVGSDKSRCITSENFLVIIGNGKSWCITRENFLVIVGNDKSWCIVMEN